LSTSNIQFFVKFSISEASVNHQHHLKLFLPLDIALQRCTCEKKSEEGLFVVFQPGSWVSSTSQAAISQAENSTEGSNFDQAPLFFIGT